MVAEARAVAVEEKDDECDERELQERVAHVHGCSEHGAHDGFQSLLQRVPEGVGVQNGDELLVKPVAHHRDFGDPGGKLKARGDPGAKKLHGLRDLLRGGDEQKGDRDQEDHDDARHHEACRQGGTLPAGGADLEEEGPGDDGEDGRDDDRREKGRQDEVTAYADEGRQQHAK